MVRNIMKYFLVIRSVKVMYYLDVQYPKHLIVVVLLSITLNIRVCKLVDMASTRGMAYLQKMTVEAISCVYFKISSMVTAGRREKAVKLR